MERTARNGKTRFETLYEEYRLPVLAYCARRTGSSDAADVCAETFFVAWRRIDDIPEPPKALPYLYRIAGNVLSNQLRTNRRHHRLAARLAGLGITPSHDPLNVVVQNSLDDAVVAAVRRLKPADREIVMLAAWEDLPREAIAEMFGMSKAAVDQRIHRAYQRLARVLGPALARDGLEFPPIATRGEA
ncbi:MAG: sigma-70 family RNA polymerase sigma factor [Acidimicrobiia bacterium]